MLEKSVVEEEDDVLRDCVQRLLVVDIKLAIYKEAVRRFEVPASNGIREIFAEVQADVSDVVELLEYQITGLTSHQIQKEGIEV